MNNTILLRLPFDEIIKWRREPDVAINDDKDISSNKNWLLKKKNAIAGLTILIKSTVQAI